MQEVQFRWSNFLNFQWIFNLLIFNQMKETIQKLDNQARFSLLTTTLGFALFVLILINLLDAIMYMLLLLQEPEYESILLSFKEWHYTINDKKMGLSVFYNFLGGLALWFLIICHALKSINKPVGWNSFFDVQYRQFE